MLELKNRLNEMVCTLPAVQTLGSRPGLDATSLWDIPIFDDNGLQHLVSVMLEVEYDSANGKNYRWIAYEVDPVSGTGPEYQRSRRLHHSACECAQAALRFTYALTIERNGVEEAVGRPCQE